MIGTHFRGMITAVAALASACAPAATPPAGAPSATAAPLNRPALWELADDDTTIYLFGTIHLLPPGTQWRTPLLDEAISKSNTMVMEIKLDDDPTSLAKVVMNLGMSPGLPPIIDRVPPDKKDALKAVIASTGYPEGVLDRMETWAAGLMLLGASFAKLGLNSDQGVERQLTNANGAAQKPIVALETAEQQFGYFDHLSEEAQRAFLLGAVENPESTQEEFKAMLKAWLAGDVPEIAKTFDSETGLSPELRDVLMRRRNAQWADWLRNRLKEPGTIFVAVGAGHLAGEDSVQHLLETKGLHVRRLQ